MNDISKLKMLWFFVISSKHEIVKKLVQTFLFDEDKDIFYTQKKRYRKPGWLWTDLDYFYKYLHNDEIKSRFHIGIS